MENSVDASDWMDRCRHPGRGHARPDAVEGLTDRTELALRMLIAAIAFGRWLFAFVRRLVGAHQEVAMKSVAISSGHGIKIRGASGSPRPPYLEEVDEAIRVMNCTAEFLRGAGVTVKTFTDTTSTSQGQNLDAIVNWHNKQSRELDVSIHFNAYQQTSKPMGTECLYKTQEALAKSVADKTAAAGKLINRGAKYRSDLKFLNSTAKPAILQEVVFVDSSADADLYRANFDAICKALAEAIAGKAIDDGERPPVKPPIEPPVEPSEPEPLPPNPSDRPTIGKGDKGPAVESVQISIGLIPDGDFGPVTEGGVKGFQAAAGLAADGVVGPKTWTELDALDERKGTGNDGLSYEQSKAIVAIANASAIAQYKWKDRGKAPEGYTAGIALCFALAAIRLAEGDPAFEDMAQADHDNEDKDALTWLSDEFDDGDMDNSRDGIDTLRHLFVLLLGLGLRELSGRYCEGRDMSATNVAADTAEAGMHQTSYNIRSCSAHVASLLEEYWANPNGFLGTFRFGVAPDSNDLGQLRLGRWCQAPILEQVRAGLSRLCHGARAALPATALGSGQPQGSRDHAGRRRHAERGARISSARRRGVVCAMILSTLLQLFSC